MLNVLSYQRHFYLASYKFWLHFCPFPIGKGQL
jgi:hypothetical protein